MLPIYCTFILISTLIGYATNAQVGVEPQFSPLTPYQTADSLPPPVYGLLEDRSDTDAKLIAPKSADNRRNHYGSKQKESGEISGLPSKKRLLSTSSKNEQMKNWKVPLGAKLIGYNVQMIAGYIPTTYLNNRSQKDNKEKLQSEDSEASLDTYSKYLPGYNMKRIKNDNVNQKSDEMDTVSAESDIYDELMIDRSIMHANFTRGESRNLEKREDSTNINATNTTVGLSGFDGFLWPVVETELESEKQEEEMDRSSIAENNESFDATASIDPIEHNLSVFKKNTGITRTIKLDFQHTRDRLEDNLIPAFQSTVATSSARSTASVNEGKNLEMPQLRTPQNTNLSMKSKHNDEIMGNSTLVSEVPQLLGGMEKAVQQIPFFQQFTSTKLQMNYTDRQAKEPTTKVFQVASKISKNTVDSASIQQNSIDKNQPIAVTTTITKNQPTVSTTIIHKNPPTIGPIIQTTKPNERERTIMDNIKGISAIHVTTPASWMATSNTFTMPRTTTMNIDFSEFDEEDYDKAEENEDSNNFLKLENPEGFSDIQLANEQKRKANKKLDSEQDSRNVHDNDEHEEPFQDEEISMNDRGGDNERFSQEKSTGVKSNSDDANGRNKGNLRSEYDEKDDDNDDDIGNDDDDGGDGDDHDDDDDGHNIDDNDGPKVIKENGDEVLRSHMDSEEKQGRVNAPIFSPEQIPTFEEWLSSLPIQPAFPFGAKNGMRNQPSANPIHLSFPRPFSGGSGRGGSRNEENGQDGQHSFIDSKKKKQARLYDYDDYEDEDKGQFQEHRFTLPRNVPYE